MNFSEFYLRHRETLLRALDGSGLDPGEAESLVQDLFVWVLERWGRLPFPPEADDARYYLLRAVRNRLRTYVRRKFHRDVPLDAARAIAKGMRLAPETLLDLDRLLQDEPPLRRIYGRYARGEPLTSTERGWLHRHRERLQARLQTCAPSDAQPAPARPAPRGQEDDDDG